MHISVFARDVPYPVPGTPQIPSHDFRPSREMFLLKNDDYEVSFPPFIYCALCSVFSDQPHVPASFRGHGWEDLRGDARREDQVRGRHADRTDGKSFYQMIISLASA